MRTTIFPARYFHSLFLFIFLLSPLIGRAQESEADLPYVGRPRVMEIDRGIRTFGTLANTTVNLSGRAELHLTAAEDPIPGTIINLNSSDAWLFLDRVQPSFVIANYLRQIHVNGHVAVLNDNVRVVEYVMGTVVIPHPPTFFPLQVFTRNRFAGDSAVLGLYTYYTSANLERQISSFILKRGYMATFAQQSNGGGASRLYVAQDSDIEISALPPELNGAVGFVRVIPWKWIGKKGWSGGAQPLVNPLWNYDWDNATTSSMNIEYVPMRHNLYWNSYTNINNKPGSTHVLGFNEPDRPDQANLSVATALAQWPNLMASGLRLGSPAPSDGGLNWLYDFIDQADALNYRVDYVAVHYYKGGWTAAQLRDWLWGIHVRTGRPLWVTEWNNGANWTCCAPTLESNAQTIGEFMDAMNQSPFVERYSIYNWVGPNREMVINNALTPAGVVYRDKVVPNSYVQELPSGTGGNATYLMRGNAWENTGSGNDGMLVGDPSFAECRCSAQTAVKLDGIDDYVQLPGGLGRGSGFTFSAWVNWDGGAGSPRIFDLSDGANQNLYLTASSADATLRFAATTSGASGERRLEAPALTPGVWSHVAVTIDGTVGRLYVNGALVASASNMPSLAALKTKYNYLGKSQSASDPLFAGRMGEAFFAGYALTETQVSGIMTQILPPQFIGDPLVKADGSLYQPYRDSLAGDAFTSDEGALTFTKLAGPEWLNVAADGTLSGTPGVADVGTNTFTVRVVNASGVAAVTRLTIKVTLLPQLIARYSFESEMRSQVGFFPDASGAGFPAYDQGRRGRALVLDGRNNFVTLPRQVVATSTDLTVATWVLWNGGANWQRIFDFGNGASQYLYLTPSSGAGTMRFGIANGGTEQMLETAALPANQWTHVAVTLSGTTGRLYVNGVLAASSENITIHPSDFRPMQNYIGKSQFPDPLFSGRLDEFLIYNYGLSSEQIAALAADRNPPSFVSDPISRPDAVSGQLYNGSIEDAATDDDPGEVLTYSKVTGPSWLQVAPSGRIFGTPAAGDAGQNRITVRVTDQALVSTDAVLVINIPVAPPSAPSGLAAKAGYGQVTLTWTGAARATSYNLKRSTTSGGPYATIAGSIIGTSYTDTALVNDTAAYYYVVSAVNSLAESADSGEAGATPSSSTVVIVANPGFETPVTTSFIYNPSSNNEWMFSGSPGSGSGVATNNSGFTSANPNAPEGRQVAFLQSSAIISQTLGGFVKGQTYRLTFLAAQRTRAAQIGQTWEVRIDGVTVASFAPPQSSNTYSEYTATFTAGAATHTLAVVGTNINGGDNTIFLDNVRIAQVP